MEPINVRPRPVLLSVDWVTILLCLILMGCGWLSVCGASYEYGQPDFIDWGARSGKQLLWIGCSMGLGLVILLLDDKIFDTFANLFYAAFMLLLLVTPLLATNHKGSYSWIDIGSVSLQPAEFAKCATALALAKFMGAYGFDIHRMKDFAIAAGLVFLPIALIIMQRETGSALVYLSFFLMMYREGMSGSILFTGVAAVVFFIVGVRFNEEMLSYTLAPMGSFVVLVLIMLSTVGMMHVYHRDTSLERKALLLFSLITFLSYGVSRFLWQFNVIWPLTAVLVVWAFYLCYAALRERRAKLCYIACFIVGSLAFLGSTDYVMSHVLELHQQTRIKVSLGMIDDPTDLGYNVNQSKIAIGSGGLEGKGFMNGTQTKLKFVPEQTTDFIFCTVGEEEGFWGSALVLLLFLTLILRLIHLAERQSSSFGRIYGYVVMSVFLFHLFVNVGMVVGITPVVGIPLPFFSYGGSSLWGFTLLLFIFLRIDAGRGSKR